MLPKTIYIYTIFILSCMEVFSFMSLSYLLPSLYATISHESRGSVFPKQLALEVFKVYTLITTAKVTTTLQQIK